MDQVLFWIPIHTTWTPQGVPIHGFGVMLVAALFAAGWVAGRLARRLNIPADKMQDLIFWVCLCGVIGGRVLYIYWFGSWENFFILWNGGLVFYGGAIGGAIAGVVAYRRLLKPLGVSVWSICDVLAPATVVGLCLGRIGCLLNGCCWGHCAAPDLPAVHFPSLTAPARDQLVSRDGRQTLAGFAMEALARDYRTVGVVESGSPAESAGLKRGDIITAINGMDVEDYQQLVNTLYDHWPRGEAYMSLRVKRGDQVIDLPKFKPLLLGVYPTQIYESISAALLFLALVATWPVRRYDGQLLVLLMLGYAAHRFVNESLREDTPPYGPFTLSQWISVGIFAGGLLLAAVRRTQIKRATSGATPANQ
jgi:phosphatidylglycerol---prolipoprotein diacylglyceryl transferase